jgi:hypothetical protein
MAAETLTKLRWSHFEEDWQRRDIPHSSIPSNILKGHGKAGIETCDKRLSSHQKLNVNFRNTENG